MIDEIINSARNKGFLLSNIYINIIPIFISSIQKVFFKLRAQGLKASGYDSNVYLDLFEDYEKIDLKYLNYSIIKLPQKNN